MPYSKLYTAPPYVAAVEATTPDGRAVAVVVGSVDAETVVYHAPCDATVPEDATVIRNGKSSWTWNGLADTHPEVADVVMPHEFLGEPTAKNLNENKLGRVKTVRLVALAAALASAP